MPVALNGRIKATDSGPGDLSGCLVEVFFDQLAATGSTEQRLPAAGPDRSGSRAPKPSPIRVSARTEPPGGLPTPGTNRIRLSARTDSTGHFVIYVPDEPMLASKNLQFVVSAPAGQTIGNVSLDIAVAKDSLVIPVETKDVAPIPLAQPTYLPKATTRRIAGQVVDRTGKSVPASSQVLILARSLGDTGPAETGVPVLVARTDGSGNFFGEAPNDKFERAAALVAGVATEIAIALDDGLIPNPLRLLVDIPETTDPEPKADGCGGDATPRTPSHADIENAPDTFSTDLGIGSCVQFNRPNRAIEEFDFYTVVRTTEPSIVGFTAAGDPMAGAKESYGPAAAAAVAAAKVATAKAAAAAIDGKKADATATQYENALQSLGHPADPAGQETVRVLTIQALEFRTKATAAQAVAASTAAAATASTQAAEAAKTTEIAARAELAARIARGRPPGRGVLNSSNPIDWDETPTFYQAAEIAHGHLLHFKQVWYADGYSLGDLLYSLPLAPGQKKLISVVDWERRERTGRTEDTVSNEGLNATLSRDRDLGEVVTGALTETSRGGSQSTSVGAGAGTGGAGNGSYQGFNFGALIGVSGGYGDNNSTAWQDSARSLSSSSLQNLHDSTVQSASAVRSLRTSVVHSVSQGEAVRATTEVVANHNHCHAITIQYFEVLRHLKLEHKLADVQDCLFVPLPMSEFDPAKALRWRQPLQTYLQRPELAGGFDAARRVQTNWSQVDSPPGRYADESVVSLSGELLLTVFIPMPPFPERPKPRPQDPAETAQAIADSVNPTTGFLGVVLAIATGGVSLVAGAATTATINATKAAALGVRGVADDLYASTPQERYDKFHHDIVPGVVQGFIDQLDLWALVDGVKVPIKDADFTLASEYQPGVPLLVSLRATLAGQLQRSHISQLIIMSAIALPSSFRAIVNSATIRYRTSTFEHSFVDDRKVNDDIDAPKAVAVFSDPLHLLDYEIRTSGIGNGAALYTPIDAWEQRSPRTDDMRLAAELVEHLNDNFEYYHHAIWWAMDPARRYMLLDGYYAPGSKNRSVASVVENRLIGIVGNSVVLPVARGVHLNPRFATDKSGKRADLTHFYKLDSPVAASRVSLPTRGVFAESVMGACNSCEQIDESKFWRWEEAPIDEPPSIEPTSTATRRSEPGPVLPSTFPTPIVSIQTAPSAPDPAGVRVALDALGKESFADITGLAATQANAAAAYQQALDTAFKFGKEASTLAQQAAMLGAKDKTMGAIDSAEQSGKIDASDAKQLRLTAFKKMVGETPVDAKASTVADRLAVIDKQEAAGGITKETAAAYRANVLKGLDPEEASRNEAMAANTETQRSIPAGAIKSFKTPYTEITTDQPQISKVLGGAGDAIRWQDLIDFVVDPTIASATVARGMEIQTLERAQGDLNLDEFHVVITKLPNRPGTATPFDDTDFFEHVRKNFPLFLQPFPRIDAPLSLETYEASDATLWASAVPTGSVLKFSIDPNPLPLWTGVATPLLNRIVREYGLVLCSEYATKANEGHHWNFTTLKLPGFNEIGHHPVSGTRQFGLVRGNDWVFYVRAADRTTTLFEYLGSDLAYAAADMYWNYFQTKLIEFVVTNKGEARFGQTWSQRYDWRMVYRMLYGRDPQTFI